MIHVEHVTKRYPGARGAVVALPPTSLDVRRGELLCVAGESGAGKSTLLGVIGLLTTPDAGTVVLDGRDCTAMSSRQRDELRSELVGIVPQLPRLFPELSALRNVELARRTPDRVATERLLAHVGLADRVDHAARTLSGGEQQRLSLARAIVNGPPVVLADEPTSGLDDRNAEVVGTLLARLAADGAAVVVASHDARMRAYATRTLELTVRSAA
ncbi:ATP-binding cassette domain-containing protein [Actinotalea sp. AC32]|nr:ATP-binding cassette domain-containing protein [Actinotalea sp. AC32]